MATTLFASGPFAPSTASNCTCAPSASDLKPSPAIEEWWTNTSLPPSAGVMNPYPFASLNHFTVPVAIQNTSSTTKERAGEAHAAQPVLARITQRTVARPGRGEGPSRIRIPFREDREQTREHGVRRFELGGADAACNLVRPHALRLLDRREGSRPSARRTHELRTAVSRVVLVGHEPVARERVRDALHALTGEAPGACDLRDRQR